MAPPSTITVNVADAPQMRAIIAAARAVVRCYQAGGRAPELQAGVVLALAMDRLSLLLEEPPADPLADCTRAAL